MSQLVPSEPSELVVVVEDYNELNKGVIPGML